MQLVSLASFATAVEKMSDPNRIFIEAQQAYDAEEIDTAIEKYQALLGSGLADPTIFFNLGNAYYRNGELGQAMLNYQRAAHLSPSDPDIAANINFTAQRTGANIPQLPLQQKFASLLSTGTWASLATLGFWAAALMLILRLYFPRLKQQLGTIAIYCLFLTVLAAVGTSLKHSYDTQTRLVTLATEVKALFAPLENSTAHFSLPEGSIATFVEKSGSWIRIQSGKESGWIRLNSCETIYPWVL